MIYVNKEEKFILQVESLALGDNTSAIGWLFKTEKLTTDSRRMNQKSRNDLRREGRIFFTVGRENENRTKLVLELRSN